MRAGSKVTCVHLLPPDFMPIIFVLYRIGAIVVLIDLAWTGWTAQLCRAYCAGCNGWCPKR